MAQNNEELICDVCNQIVYCEEGKNPERVLNGHKIQCRIKYDKEQAENLEAQKGKPQELRQGSREDNQPARKERIPFGIPKAHFIAPENDGYFYRVFNDEWAHEPGRIERANAAGYEIVDKAGSRLAVGTNESGSRITGILMRIPQELYDKDQALKQEEVDKVDKQIFRGNYLENPEDKRYIPRGGGVKAEVKLTS